MQLGDETAKLATRFTPQQIALFRAIVRASFCACSFAAHALTLPPSLWLRSLSQVEVVCSDARKATHGIDSLAVLSLPLSAPTGGEASQQDEAGPSQAPPPMQAATLKMSASDRQAALASMVSDGWLLGDAQSSFRLGPRSFLELGHLLAQATTDEAIQDLWKQYF